MNGQLTDSEFAAVYDWISREKDRLPSPLKEGLLKLVNREAEKQAVVQAAAPRPGVEGP
jgi:hypothetical protein